MSDAIASGPDSARQLIAELERLGVSLWVENTRLRFKAPLGSLSPELKQRLAEHRAQLVALLSGPELRQDAQLPPVVAGAADRQRCLSFAQQRLWFLDQLLPDRPTYNMAYAYRLRGALDVEALRQALCDIVQRHEILRTGIVAVEGAAQPRLVDKVALDLPLTDLTGCVESEREVEAQQLVTREARRPFDLNQAPLVRAPLLRMSPSEHWLVLCLHHVVNDDWSFDVLWQELEVAYEARRRGVDPGLPELRIQYADFAAWQNEQLQANRFEGQVQYWRQQLAGHRPVLDLPTDRPRPRSKAYRGDRTDFTVPGRVVGALRLVAQRSNATLYIVLAAALKTLLHRYSLQDDVMIGTAIAGRRQPEVESLMGFFINTLVLRTNLAGNPGFLDLVGRVREVALAAYAHQDVPFERVIEELQPDRDPSRTPFFDVLLVLHKVPSPRRLQDLQIEQLPVTTGTAKFDLTLELAEKPDGSIQGFFEYDSDLFDRSTTERLVGHFQALLEGIAEAPDRRLSEFPLLSAAECSRLQVDWNATVRDYPRERCIQELFEARAEVQPGRVAVRAGAVVLSYGELEARANQIAHGLRARGMGRGQRVGLCVERGADMLAAVLGILKSGAAYVPLDPLFPQERLRFMAEDAELALLVSTSALVEPFGLPREQQLLLDADAQTTESAPATRLPVDAQSARPEDPAYVIYTSGSTGKPKGVVVPHRAVVNFLTSMAREPGLSADDVLVAVTTLSFDIAVLELELPLAVGATVVMASREQAMDGHALKGLLTEHRATVMQATPVTWRLLLEAGWAGGSGFKALVGGEALPRDLAEALLARGVGLWNMYGPTETTVWSTCARITDTANGITIGRPIANTTVYVLDGHGNLCPIGVGGELCIGGAGVTLGYWRRPELTAERFVADPFSTLPGARLYRTGDRARWRADGTLEHLGRLDFQIKLRGFRIEAGEIETAIVQHAAVREAVVVAREDVPGDQRLIAYLVAENPPVNLVEQLRSLLRASLPEYMVPASFVPVDAIPLTQNGKVDRSALSEPVRLGPEVTHVAPRTLTEQILVGKWAEVLRLERVGIAENFFELGGHSLLAIKVVAELRKAFRIDLQVRTLFDAPTVAELSRHIEEQLVAEIEALSDQDAQRLVSSGSASRQRAI